MIEISHDHEITTLKLAFMATLGLPYVLNLRLRRLTCLGFRVKSDVLNAACVRFWWSWEIEKVQFARSENLINTAASGKKQQRSFIFIQYVYSSVDSITLIKQLRQQQKWIIFIKLACFMLSWSLVFWDSSLSIIHNQKTANHSKFYHMISWRTSLLLSCYHLVFYLQDFCTE